VQLDLQGHHQSLFKVLPAFVSPYGSSCPKERFCQCALISPATGEVRTFLEQVQAAQVAELVLQ
jgi:hypothetical protein